MERNQHRTTSAYLASSGPIAFAHRGYSPEGAQTENTVRAFRAALEHGIHYLETDLRTSSDGVVFAFHDQSLERVSDGLGPLSEKTAAELAAVRVAGEPIPRFEELLVTFPQVKFNLDLKDDAAGVPTARLIEKYGAHDRVLVASFSRRRRRKLLAQLSLPVACSAGVTDIVLFVACSAWLPTTWLRRLLRSVDCLQIPRQRYGIPLVTKKSVARAHRLGLAVHVWTINDATEIRQLLDLGVDGIFSDRADLLAQALRGR